MFIDNIFLDFHVENGKRRSRRFKVRDLIYHMSERVGALFSLLFGKGLARVGFDKFLRGRDLLPDSSVKLDFTVHSKVDGKSAL